jgi:carbonic anhydrase
MRLAWNYKAAKNAVARFNGHQVEVEGDFGELDHTMRVGQKKFKAHKLTFKFPAEHKLDDKAYDGEILIHHRAIGGDHKAILSILLKENDNGDADNNQFIDDLDAETWILDKNE